MTEALIGTLGYPSIGTVFGLGKNGHKEFYRVSDSNYTDGIVFARSSQDGSNYLMKPDTVVVFMPRDRMPNNLNFSSTISGVSGLKGTVVI